MRITGPVRHYISKEARRLREHSLRQVLPHAMHNRYWQRGLRWLRDFEAWVRPFLRQEAIESGNKQPSRPLRELLQDNELCKLFIRRLFKREVGFSVPRACRRHLSAARQRLRLPSLNEDSELADLIRGYERSMPRTVVQALSLSVDDIQRIAHHWGGSKDWWKVNLSTLMAVGFICILRGVEVRRLKVEGVRLVSKEAREVSASEVVPLPTVDAVKGAFIHLVWRKSKQAHDVWVPISCRLVLKLLLKQLTMLRAVGRTQGPLFPSRTGVGGGRSLKNSIGEKAMKDGMRKALIEVCGMTRDQALLYKGHSLRVGGSNHMRLLGVADEVHRLMGGWASLVSSRGYFQLGTDEQLKVAEQFALKERVTPRVEGGRPLSLRDMTGVTIQI